VVGRYSVGIRRGAGTPPPASLFSVQHGAVQQQMEVVTPVSSAVGQEVK
jgi:hypothetical protein